jgi:4-diphosphocytidyl-2-C-methyl-D-erythritol kinase
MSLTSDRRLESGFLRDCIGLSAQHEHLILAPAKVNLRLKLLGRRPDGYHLLSMLNASTSLCDELRIILCEAPGVSLAVDPVAAVLGPQSDNLVVRAWDEFWREFSVDGPPCGVSVVIAKKIPIGGGLGGGSSDAAAILRFLVAIFGMRLGDLIDLSKAELDARVMQVALRVGADVPYAYSGGLCWVTGIGERVLPLSSLVLWPGEVLITVPPVSVPTIEFYRFLREQLPEVAAIRDLSMERLVSGESKTALADLIENDFERYVVALSPKVGEALALARQYYPDTTAVTGSGAAIFSLVPAGEGESVATFERLMVGAGMAVHRGRLLESL